MSDASAYINKHRINKHSADTRRFKHMSHQNRVAVRLASQNTKQLHTSPSAMALQPSRTVARCSFASEQAAVNKNKEQTGVEK